MKACYYSLFMLIFTVLPLFAAKKPDARSAYLQQMPAKYALESLDAFQSVGNGKAFIKMFHNEESVKVLIAVPEENMQIKFLMQGLKVYLDVAGKKSKKYYIQFLRIERDQMFGNMQQRPEPGQQGMRPQGQMAMDLKWLIANANMYNVMLSKGKNKTILDMENAYIQLFEETNVVFAVYLPLSLIGSKTKKNRMISVGLSAEMEAPQSMGMGGGMPIGGGGRQMGGGGMPMGGGGGRNFSYKKHE